MPLTLQNQGDASTDTAFRSRVRASVLRAALAVANEATNTANHIARIEWAGNVLREPESWALRIATTVAAQSGPASAASLAAVTDAQINTAVDSLIDAYALNAL
jgi:hypothetical protein